MSTTPSAMLALQALRDSLAAVAGVVTCRIGLEATMTSEDYPMVRIVPSRVQRAPVIGQRRVECLVYFGSPVHEFTGGLEALYTSLLTMEAALITAAETSAAVFVRYIETVADEDRVDGYKLMALRVEVEG